MYCVWTIFLFSNIRAPANKVFFLCARNSFMFFGNSDANLVISSREWAGSVLCSLVNTSVNRFQKPG